MNIYNKLIYYSLLPIAIASDETTQANNPLANMTAFNLQNYYIEDLSESDREANRFWFRYAKPFSVSDTTI